MPSSLYVEMNYKEMKQEEKHQSDAIIVVYARNSEGIGHVAIYAGNGKIVEAQSSATGITDNRPLENGRKIIAIRRVLPNP